MNNSEKLKREREPPETKFKNTAVNLLLSSRLRTFKSNTDLRQFKSKNITRHRKNAVTSEVKEAKLDKIIHTAENKKTALIKTRKETSKQLYGQVKIEYGSIENYAKVKREPNFRKSETHYNLSFKRTEIDRDTAKQDVKLSRFSAIRESILCERKEKLYFTKGVEKHKGLSIYSPNKLERNAALRDLKLEKVTLKMPRHRIIRKSYMFNDETGKVEKRLIIEKEFKPIDKGGIVTKGLKCAGAVTTLKLSQSIHGEISKNTGDNDSAKMAHTGFRIAEDAAIRSVKFAHKFLHERPYKKMSRLQLKSDKSNAKLYAARQGGSAKQMRKNAQSYMNKAKQARKATTKADKVKGVVKIVTTSIKKVVFSPVMLILLCGVLLFVLFMSLIFSLFPAIGANSGAFLGVCLAEDEEIYSAESYANEYTLTAVENAINAVIAAIPTDYVVINPYTLSRNPYALLAFLSAYSFVTSGDKYDNAFNASDSKIKKATESYINTFCYISYNVTSHSVTYTSTDDEGNTTAETITYTTLNISVLNKTEDETAQIVYNSGSPYSPEMYDYYLFYLETNGFRDDLF